MLFGLNGSSLVFDFLVSKIDMHLFIMTTAESQDISTTAEFIQARKPALLAL
jgi:hypothetical protein